MERRGKKLLGSGAVAAVSDIEGVLAAIAALLEIGTAHPSYGDSAGAREERGVGVGVGGKERKRSYCGPEDKRKNKWAS